MVKKQMLFPIKRNVYIYYIIDYMYFAVLV
jgi:hypothetical protein